MTKTLAALFTASVPQQLLSKKTAGHIGISFINTERGREEEGEVWGGGERGDGE